MLRNGIDIPIAEHNLTIGQLRYGRSGDDGLTGNVFGLVTRSTNIVRADCADIVRVLRRSCLSALLVYGETFSLGGTNVTIYSLVCPPDARQGILLHDARDHQK